MDFIRRLRNPKSKPQSVASDAPTTPRPPSASSGLSATSAPPAESKASAPPKIETTSVSEVPVASNIPLPDIQEGLTNVAPMPEIMVTNNMEGVQVDPMPTPAILPSSITADIGMISGNATRPLPPLEIYALKPGKHLIYGLSSDIGQTRSNNQDAMFAFFAANVSSEEKPDLALFAVADGMGGYSHGEKASAIAVRVVAKQMIQNFYLDILGAERMEQIDADKPPIAEMLSEAIQKANEAVAGKVPEGGTTLTVAAIMGDMAYIGHVGDSRAYMFSNDHLEQITRDHSLVQRLVELEQLTPEEAAVHMQRNVLYRALGQSEALEVDALVRRLPSGARLILCSDGLWNAVPEEILVETIKKATSPQEATDRLIEIANQRGGLDNITAIVVQLPG